MGSVSIIAMNRNKFDASHSWSDVHMTFCDKEKIYKETVVGAAMEFHGFEKDNDLIDFDHIKSPFVPCKIQGTNREKETFDVVYYWNTHHAEAQISRELTIT